jgi:sensor histidine kinase YesM
MLLQPLVENAIQHGLEPKIAGGHVRVQARMQEGRLCLMVEDDGSGIDGAPTSGGTGVGLANVRERLAAHYGNRARLDVAARPAGGTVVTLTLPLQGGHT